MWRGRPRPRLSMIMAEDNATLGWRGDPPFAPLFFAKVGAEDLCSAGLPSHLRRFPLKAKTWLASAESTDPKRDRLVESYLSQR